MHVIAHLSDPHLDGTSRSRTRWSAVAAHVRGLPTPVDAIVVTGDVVHGDVPGEHAWAAAELGTDVPVGWCPGNADLRAPFREALAAGGPPDDPVDSVVRLDGLAIVLLDSLVEGEVAGAIGDASLAWLHERLRELEGAGHVLVALHHPPVDLGHAKVDPVLLRQPDALTRVLGDHPEVVAVLAGHVHGSIATTVAGRPLRIAPGIASELLLPWEVTHDGPPLFDLDAPPAIAYHVIHDDGRVTSHHRTVALASAR